MIENTFAAASNLKAAATHFRRQCKHSLEKQNKRYLLRVLTPRKLSIRVTFEVRTVLPTFVKKTKHNDVKKRKIINI